MLHPEEAFNIQKNTIRAKFECSVEIDEKEYDERTFIETSDKITLPGVLQFYIPQYNDFAQIAFNYSIDLIKTPNIEHDKNTQTIHYVKDDIVISKDYVPDETDIGLLIRLLQGRIKYVKDPKIIISMLHDILPGIDLIHLELIVANMFRTASDPSVRCRQKGNYTDCIILGQNKQPFVDSWASSLSFQYIDKAIAQGLVKGKDAENNPIEKVLNEQFRTL